MANTVTLWVARRPFDCLHEGKSQQIDAGRVLRIEHETGATIWPKGLEYLRPYHIESDAALECGVCGQLFATERDRTKHGDKRHGDERKETDMAAARDYTGKEVEFAVSRLHGEEAKEYAETAPLKEWRPG